MAWGLLVPGMATDSIKPMLRSALLGFALGLVVVFAAGYTLSRGAPRTPTMQR